MRLASRLPLVLLAVLTFCLAVHPVAAQVVINEIDYDQVGADNAEFLEIKNVGGGVVNLDNYTVQLVNGTGGGAAVYDTIDLPNVNLAAGDYYVICANAATVVNCDLDDGPNTDFIQNGSPDAIGLRLSGVLVDAVSYEGNSGAPYTETAGAPVASSDSNTIAFLGLSRFPDGTDSNNNSADLSLRCITPGAANISAATGCAAPALSGLNINDVSLAEGDPPPGTTTFTFAVTLTAPAGPGGVTFDIATADNTATTAGNDYVANSLTGQSIPMGSTGPYNFSVTVNRDTAAEPNETFFVNVTNITGATAGDTQGLGTISNDDVSLTPIHDIQGPGASSPLAGSSVTTRGIVTGVRSNGFFIQEPDASVDADPNTSEGVLVFTGGAPPAAAVVGALVQVTGTVTEFVPSQDPLQPPLTELTSPSVVQISTGNPLPVPIPLTSTFPDPAGPHDQLERLEGMRVAVASLTVSGPTLGNVNEPNATATSSGVFFGVVTGVPRPFREPGIQAPDPAPAGGSIPPIPRFDSNPERIRVDSDGLVGGLPIDVGTGAVVTGLVGPLDYTFRTYTILPDPATPPSAAGGPVALMAAAATAQEFTVASYNMERFFDTVNDPAIGEPVLTAAAFDMRLNKASLAIRDFLKTPDILGVVEVENLTTLQALAARINSDAVAASQPDPQYVAHLVEGNDIGGIDVGFLVKTAVVAGSTPRVEVVEVQQELDGTLFVNPDSSTDILNDRPPLRLNAIIHHMNGASFPVTVIVNHLRSLNGVNVETPGDNGWPTDGARVRAKRQAQAEDLANLVQARQTADLTERIVLVGDFNAFEVNDGLADLIDTILGTPVPDNETAVPGDGADLVNPDLDNLDDTPPPSERYSYIFDGNAQTLDHVLVNQALIADTTAQRIEHPRINADFPQTARNDGTTPARLSDHDPVVAYFQVPGFATAGVTIQKIEQPGSDPVTAGTDLTYTINVINAGPDTALNLAWSDTLPAGTTFVSLGTAPGWTCTTPAVGSGGTVSCSTGSQSVGTSPFTLTVHVDPDVAAGTILSNTANVTTTTADDPSDNSATETTTVAATADLSVSLLAPSPVTAGTNLTYNILVSNSGPSAAASVSLSTMVPAGTTFVSLSSPAGWSCSTPAVGAGGPVSCSIATLLPPGNMLIHLTVAVGSGVPPGPASITNTVTVTSPTSDPDTNDRVATVSTGVVSPASVSGTKSAAGSFMPGSTVTYTVVLSNAGPATQLDNPGNEFTDVLPAGLTLVSATATSGTAVATVGTNTVTWNGSIPASGSVTITITATVSPAAIPGTTISNQGTFSYDDDGNGINEASGVTDDPATAGPDSTAFVVVAGGTAGPADIPTLDEAGLALLVLLLAMGGAVMLRRRRA